MLGLANFYSYSIIFVDDIFVDNILVDNIFYDVIGCTVFVGCWFPNRHASTTKVVSSNLYEIV